MQKPDLSHIDPDIRAYIEALEAELERLRPRPRKAAPAEEEAPLPPLVLSEEPTAINLIAISASGLAKRTPRHLYQRQRRGGMGIFDIDLPEEERPAILATAEPGQHLLIFTNLARAFRLPVSAIVETPIRSKGEYISGKFNLLPGEFLAAALPDQARGAVALVSERGMVRYLRHHVFGDYMKPGTPLFEPNRFGSLVAACRTPGDADLLIVTRLGKAIRFSEKLVPPTGGPGIRLDEGDTPVAIAAVDDDSLVYLAEADGKGTIRTMASFNANKSAGGGGKLAMKSDQVVAAHTVAQGEDIFMISRLCKIIRFMGDEVPAKEGVVQGVNCMALRADQVTAATIGHFER